LMDEDSLNERLECQQTQVWKRDWQVTVSGPQKWTENSRCLRIGFCIRDKAAEEYVDPFLQGRRFVREGLSVCGTLAVKKTENLKVPLWACTVSYRCLCNGC